MSQDGGAPDRLIWATRGRSWGFRFLLDAGLPDPLPTYERAFADLLDASTTWRRDNDVVALRLIDPEGRRDLAGRPIPHEFVLLDKLADEVNSVADGLTLVWPRVDATYARVWQAIDPPKRVDLEF